MKRRIFLGLAAAGALAGCGGSRLNPRNWFGQSRETARGAPADEARNPLLPEAGEGGLFDNFRREASYAGVPLQSVSALMVEPASGGAIIRVRGIADRQDVHDVRLVPDTPGGGPVGGVLGYELRGVLPEQPAPGAAGPREVHTATFVSDKTLEGVREVRVRAAQNARVSRR
jgi:hypothetical protein